MRRGGLDWNEGKAMLIGKGEAQFNPITTETGRDILDVRVVEALGLAAAGTITPLLCGWQISARTLCIRLPHI